MLRTQQHTGRLFRFFVALVAIPLVLISATPAFAQGDLGGRTMTRALRSPASQRTNEEDVLTCYSQNSANLPCTGWGFLYANISGTSNALLGAQNDELRQMLGDSSAVGTMGKTMASMISNPPASAQVWLADAFSHSPLVPQAYAQGVGFKSLSPVLPVWKAFRDVSYVFFVIAFIVIGFMIMFRQKLGGQTAVTVMSALPNLVITLLLITFSYAIAGFVIDLMYLVIYLVVGVFSTQKLLPDSIPAAGLPGSNGTITLQDVALSNNIFYNGLQLVFGNGTDSTTANAAKSVGAIVSGFFTQSGAVTGGAVLGAGVDVVAYLVFAVAIFFAVTKTFFQLLVSYVTFVISVIFSPFMLMIGAFTGKQDFWQWLKNLIATLAPFPVVITMVLLAMVLGGQSKTAGVGFAGGSGGAGFQAPQIGLFSDTGAIGAVQGLIAIGIIMLIPEAVKLSREWVGAKNPFEKYVADIGHGLKKGWEGGELVEGLKFTDTRKWPMGGLSAENLVRKGTIGLVGGGGTLVGGGASVADSIIQGKAPSVRQVTSDAINVGSSWMNTAGRVTHDPQFEAQEKAKAANKPKEANQGPPPNTNAV